MKKIMELILKYPIEEEDALIEETEAKENVPEKKEISKQESKINRQLWDSDAEQKVFHYLQDFINTDSFYVVPHILVSEVIKDFRNYNCFEDTYKRYCEFIKEEQEQTHFELMHFDFVIYNKKDFSAALIVEVDGANHKTNQSTIRSDNFKDFIAKQYAAIPLVRLDLSVANVDIETELKKMLMDKKLNEPFNYPIYCWRCGRKFAYQPNKNKPNSSFFYCTSCKKGDTNKNITLSYNEKICPPIFVWDKYEGENL